MKVKIKKLNENAIIPSYAKEGDAGMDLTAVSVSFDNDGNIVYHTGLAFEIPIGFVGLLFPRSSNSKTSLYLTNHVGVVDSGYRGEIMFKFKNRNESISTRWLAEKGSAYRVGERVGQIVILPYPSIEFELTDELSSSERGENGYGSTGK